MTVEIDDRVGAGVDEDALAGLLDGVLAAQGAADAEASLILVAPDDMQGLNRRYRGRDEVTDVLAFPIDEDDELPPGMPRLLGDVVICVERCAAQAAEQGHAPGRELVILAVHGLLHLLGHDHETDTGEMLALQDRIVAGLGEVALEA